MNFLTSAFSRDIARRSFLTKSMGGIGIFALDQLLRRNSQAAEASATHVPRGSIETIHHPPKIKRVIVLTMAGGPSHLESFDSKPELAKLHGQGMPESFTKGQPIAQLQGQKLSCFGPQHAFKKFGESGQEIAEIFPHIGSLADEICIINSLKTEAINHDPAHTFMNTGTSISGRPAMGSWINYGLGSAADNLPGFCVMTSTGRFGQSQPISSRQWHSGFLPSKFQGVELRSQGEPVLYASRPAGVSSAQQQDVVESITKLNQLEQGLVDDPEIATRIAQYELAFKMQSSVPELMDFKDEPAHVLEMYGTKGADGTFNANCLLARRLAERGVRFIQLYHRDWDHHGSVKDHMAGTAKEVDQACAALVKDLKQRDMLKDTLVLYTGEFGRTPMAQGNGRDHHIKGFSMWLCGGGIKGGLRYGKTDELGYNAVEDIVEVHDLHATILHLLGVDHERLQYRFQGRDFRLTDVAGHVLTKILA